MHCEKYFTSLTDDDIDGISRRMKESSLHWEKRSDTFYFAMMNDRVYTIYAQPAGFDVEHDAEDNEVGRTMKYTWTVEPVTDRGYFIEQSKQVPHWSDAIKAAELMAMLAELGR